MRLLTGLIKLGIALVVGVGVAVAFPALLAGREDRAARAVCRVPGAAVALTVVAGWLDGDRSPAKGRHSAYCK